MRTKIVAGNWKMNKTSAQGEALARELLEKARTLQNVEIVLCPSYIGLERVGRVIAGSNLILGAQDMHWEDQGAFTGKVSWDMLKEVGVRYVIIGHSEQRTYFHETNEAVNKKARKALANALLPILCVGETLEEREKNRTEEVVRSHVKGAFQDISKQDAVRCVVAYEPVWAIGTGKTATPEQAEEVHVFIRKLLSEIYDTPTAEAIRIQYGGSVKADNAAQIFSKPNVDGGLIGGASLKTADFMVICSAGA